MAKQKQGRKKLYGQKMSSVSIQLRPDQIEKIIRIERDPIYGTGFASLMRQIIDAGLEVLEAQA